MIEVEIKAKVMSPEMIASALEEQNFKPGQFIKETDIYYNGCCRDFPETDEALRLRCTDNITTGEKVALMTYKGPKMDSFSMTRREYETEVGDLETAAAIFENLGYSRTFEVRKERQCFSNFAGVTAYLDTVDNLGSFLELEIMLTTSSKMELALEALTIILKEIGVSSSAVTSKSYLELLMEMEI